MGNPNDPQEVTASLVARVKQNVSRYFIAGASAAERAANFRWLFLSAAASPACDAPPDEESYADRHNRYYVLAEALGQELAERYALDPQCLYILIDPSGMRCEDTVYVAYLYTPDPLDLGQAMLLYAVAVPVGLWFATLDQFTTYLAEQYAQLEGGYRQTIASVVATAD